MKHLIKHGVSIPTKTDLDNYQLGWCTGNKKLYINDEGTIRIMSSTIALGENVMVASKGITLDKNDIFTLETVTEDKIKITLSYSSSTNKVNLKLTPTDDKNISLRNAISHQEYNGSNGYKSITRFADLTTNNIDADIGNFSDAIDKNLYLEAFFTVRDYDYKIDLTVADESNTSYSAICTISRTISQ